MGDDKWRERSSSGSTNETERKGRDESLNLSVLLKPQIDMLAVALDDDFDLILVGLESVFPGIHANSVLAGFESRHHIFACIVSLESERFVFPVKLADHLNGDIRNRLAVNRDRSQVVAEIHCFCLALTDGC